MIAQLSRSFPLIDYARLGQELEKDNWNFDTSFSRLYSEKLKKEEEEEKRQMEIMKVMQEFPELDVDTI